MSFYAPYDIYDVLSQLQNQAVQRNPYQVRTSRSRQSQPSAYFSRPSREAVYHPRYQPTYQEPGFYTLDDVLDLVNRHQSLHPQSYARARPHYDDEVAKSRAAEAAAEAATIGGIREKHIEQEIENKKEVERQQKEYAKKQQQQEANEEEFNLADLIRQALLQEEEEEQQDEDSAEKPAAESRKKSVPSFHLSAPSPVHDPLQVSQPQLDTNLPFSPQVDVYDKPNFYKVVFSLPGARKDSFEIDFHPSNHELVIKGNTKKDEEDLSSLKVSEIKFGAFERSLKFPILPRIKDEEIKAKYANGLLEITIPKLEIKNGEKKPKRRVILEDVEDDEIKFEEGLKNL